MTLCHLNLHFCIIFTLCSHYILPICALQDIAWIYYMSLLAKHLITYCWKTSADLYQDTIIIIATKIFLTILFKRLNQWRSIEKSIWKDASYMGHKESSSQKLTTGRGATKSKLQKPNTNYVYISSSMQISKVFYVNKTCVSHCNQNPSSSNTSITYHVGALSMWNAVIGNTFNHPK